MAKVIFFRAYKMGFDSHFVNKMAGLVILNKEMADAIKK